MRTQDMEVRGGRETNVGTRAKQGEIRARSRLATSASCISANHMRVTTCLQLPVCEADYQGCPSGRGAMNDAAASPPGANVPCSLLPVPGRRGA